MAVSVSSDPLQFVSVSPNQGPLHSVSSLSFATVAHAPAGSLRGLLHGHAPGGSLQGP